MELCSDWWGEARSVASNTCELNLHQKIGSAHRQSDDGGASN